MRAGRLYSSEYENPVKTLVGVWVLDWLVGWHLKSVLVSKLLTVSRDWLVLGGAVSPGSEHRNTENERHA